MKNFIKNFSVVILAAAIALSPSFSAGKIEEGRVIEIRAEDILIVILGLIWIANFLISGREKIEKPPLLFPILAWLSIGLVSVLTNWILGNIEISRGFFFFLKEIEFFLLYFYLFCHIRSLDSAKLIIKIWIFLGLVNISWIIYEMITGLKLTYYYGPTPLIEPEGPLPAGGFFLLIFIFLFNILLYYYLNLNISNFKKGILTIATISPAIGVFASGSRASFLGFILALILTFLFYSLKKGFLKSFLIIIFALIFISSIFIFSKQPVVKRFLDIKDIFWNLNPENPVSRASIWISQLSEASKRPLFFLLGFGKSAVFIEERGEESHSQYVRNFIETGIIGILIFLILMFAIIKKSWWGFSTGKNSLLIGLSSGLLVATLTLLFISISAEAFLVVKINEVYWFFTALTIVTLKLNGVKKKYEE
jgi:hypothetical protein